MGNRQSAGGYGWGNEEAWGVAPLTWWTWMQQSLLARGQGGSGLAEGAKQHSSIITPVPMQLPLPIASNQLQALPSAPSGECRSPSAAGQGDPVSAQTFLP